MTVLFWFFPGINVNDIYKVTDIFVLLSDFVEMTWLVDFSGKHSKQNTLYKTFMHS